MCSPAKESRKRRRLSLRPLIIRECDDAIHPGPIFQSHLGSIIYPIEEGRSGQKKFHVECTPRDFLLGVFRSITRRPNDDPKTLAPTVGPVGDCRELGAGAHATWVRHLRALSVVRPWLQGKMTAAAAAERAATFRLYTAAAASTPGAVFSVRRSGLTCRHTQTPAAAAPAFW